jgi:hypothetical protein
VDPFFSLLCQFKREIRHEPAFTCRVAVTLLAVIGTSFYSQGQAQKQAPTPVHSRADETLAMWNSIGNKLIAMAKGFPEDKYDFKLQKDRGTFAQTLLQVAGVDLPPHAGRKRPAMQISGENALYSHH